MAEETQPTSALGAPWRTQPEIPAERQAALAERRTIPTDRERGIFPFQSVTLTRADIEWLLATHEEGRGPVLWAEEREKPQAERRQGLDLRGADLTGLDLSGLPLAGLLGGPICKRLSHENAELEEGEVGALTLRDANLRGAQLAGAQLSRAHLEAADLTGATLDDALLIETHLDAARMEGASLRQAYIMHAALVGVDLRQADLAATILGTCQLQGADLRGVRLDRAYLSGADLTEADLRGVAFAGARLVGVTFTRANLSATSFEGALIISTPDLRGANLTGASARGCAPRHWQCEEADLSEAHFEGVTITSCYFRGATMRGIHLEGATLSETELQGANLAGAHLERATLRGCRLDPRRLRAQDYHQADTLISTDLTGAHLEGAYLESARLDAANLTGASLAGADLTRADLRQATLANAHAEGATLAEAHLEGANFTGASLAGADLHRALCDERTTLRELTLADRAHGAVRLAGVRWGGADVRQLDWARVPVLGDEVAARRARDAEGQPIARAARVAATVDALRVYRQLAIAVDDTPSEPGLNVALNKVAVNYNYRAQVLQRRVYWLRRDYGRWAFAALLGALVGYGYRMGRLLLAYALAIAAFAVLFFVLGAISGPPTSPSDALLSSVTAFHGRVFSGQFGLGTPQSWVTAAEAIVGLVIESVFIAMLTQRFFGR